MRLIERARTRSNQATMDDDIKIRAAYNAHGPELYRLGLRQLSDPGAAQDVVQETFLRAWRNASTFDPELASLREWLFAIARNVVIDEVRRSRVRPWQRPVDVDPERTDVSVEPQVFGAAPRVFENDLMDSWVVEEALQRISAEHRHAIVAVHLRSRPQTEVAAELDVPVATLRTRVFYGLRALRLALEEMGIDP